jgi:hypothetical protein
MSQPTTDWPLAQPVVPLEQRVQQLESSLAALHDLQGMEERIVERISHQLQGSANAPRPILAFSEPVVEQPRAVATPLPPTIRPDFPSAAPLAIPAAAVPLPRLTWVGAGEQHPTGLAWLFVDICRDALAIFWMFVDLNYKVAWSTRALTVVLLLAILTSHWWWPLGGLPIVGSVLVKLIDLVLAFIIFKALTRESRRYMEVVKGKQ